MNDNKPVFTYEHWEGWDEYFVLGLGGPIGYTVTKKEAEIIARWLNTALPELKERITAQIFVGPVMDSKWVV